MFKNSQFLIFSKPELDVPPGEGALEGRVDGEALLEHHRSEVLVKELEEASEITFFSHFFNIYFMFPTPSLIPK